MQSLDLIFFKIKKQIKSINFIVLLVALTIFSFTQMFYIFHLPVNSIEDINYLNSQFDSLSGDFLYVNASEEELLKSTIDYLNRMKNEVDVETGQYFTKLINTIQDNNLNFKQAYNTFLKEHPDLIYWLDTCKDQYEFKIGNINQINSNLKTKLDKQGYNTIFLEDYVTYIQLITALLILPSLIMLLIKDYQHNMDEIISSQNILPSKYILCKYISYVIPLLLFLYLLGIFMYFCSIYRFSTTGWNIKWTSFSLYYLIYIVPTVLFLSSLIMFLFLVFKKAVAVFPMYIFYVIFNITQEAFLGDSVSNSLFKVIVRLDNSIPYNNFVLLNRLLYTILAIFLLLFTCKLYSYSSQRLKLTSSCQH